ncbi:MAG: ribosome silencing factor [Acidobacteriota bacterium]|jgi:ribosome-associated protein
MMNEALKIAIKAVDDKKGIDVVALDIAAVATFADYFLLCSGDSSRQVQAIADEVEQRLAARGFRPAHVEGYNNAEWILMDYLDVVVHIFSRKARAYYDLERLWRDAKAIDVAKLLEQAEPETVPVRRTRRHRS